MFEWVELDLLRSKQSEYNRSFATAKPFKSLITEDLVSPQKMRQLSAAFPEESWGGWVNKSHEHQYLKKSCTDISLIPEPLRTFIYELNSGPFLKWLSEVTGIQEVLPDPNLIGGGLHMTGPGGTLTPHTDFHVVKGFSLYRRLNLIIYLNPEWKLGDGGESWHRKFEQAVKWETCYL